MCFTKPQIGRNNMKKKCLTRSKGVYLGGVALLLFGFAVGFYLISYGELSEQYNLMLAGLLSIWLCDIGFCIFRLKQRTVLLLFHLTAFLFLISRITVSAYRGNRWWTNYSVEANVFAVNAIAISLAMLCIGTVISEIAYHYLSRKSKPEEKVAKATLINKDVLRFIVRIGLLVCMVCFFIRELDKLSFMSGKAYEEFYSSYKSRLPFVITFPASCMKYFLCMFLAFKPKKREAFAWLCVYVISALPMLKIGARGDFMLNLVFSFVYYCLRSMYEKSWFGKLEKIVAVALIPLMIFFLGAYNYIRDGEAVSLGAVDLVFDFAYKQGTTYDTVLQGYEYQDQLYGRDTKYYTFSAVTDTVLNNSLGRLLFDSPDIGEGNSFKAAYNSNSFSHGISYVVLGKDYIAGKGRGSSYIIENYLDFNMAGVAVFSMLLGAACSLMMLLFGKRWLGSVIILNMLLEFFFLHRAESMSSLSFLVSLSFWAVIAGVLILSLISAKLIDKTGLRRNKFIDAILSK